MSDLARRILVWSGRHVDDRNDGHVMENAVKYACDWFGLTGDNLNSVEDQEKLETISTLAKNLLVVSGIAYFAGQVGVPGAQLVTVACWLGQRYYQNYQNQKIEANNFEVDSDEDEEFYSCNSSFVDQEEQQEDPHEGSTCPQGPVPEPHSWWGKVKGFFSRCGSAAVNTVKDGLHWVKSTFWDAPLNWFVRNVVNPVVDFWINVIVNRIKESFNEAMSRNGFGGAGAFAAA